MIKNILLVSLGGAIGSVMRYLCQRWIYQINPHPFPWGTFMVNIVGCFLIGVFFADLAYWRTADIMWQRFSIWLLTASLILAAATAMQYAFKPALDHGHAKAVWVHVEIPFTPPAKDSTKAGRDSTKAGRK